MSDRRSVKSVARSLVGDRTWATLRRARHRLRGAKPAPSMAATEEIVAPTPTALRPTAATPKPSQTATTVKPRLIIEEHADDSWKMSRHDFLSALHEQVQPRTYLETGIDAGGSLALARCRSIGIDPAFKITEELHCDVALFRIGSDEFFARENATEHFQGLPIDLAFIDGMHLFEFALRDFMNIERHAAPSSVIVFDDMLPRTTLEAARHRQTRDWTGDVFWMFPVLAKYRPDLVVVPVDTSPTGVLVVLGANPRNTVLGTNYAEIIHDFRRPDPQEVPASILTRVGAAQPAALLAHPVWERLVALRTAGGATSEHLAEIAAATAGLPTHIG